MNAPDPIPALKSFATLVLAGLAVIVAILGMQMAFGRALMSPAVASLPSAAQQALFLLLLFALLAVIALIGLKLCGIRVGAGPHPGRDIGLGAGMGLVAMIAALALSAVAGTVRMGAAESPASWLILVAVLLTLFQTGVEELFFRGWLQKALQSGWGLLAGRLVAAIAFALLHFISQPFEAVSFATLFLAGYWLGLLAERSGGLALPLGAHFAWNGSEELLFGLSPNPGVGGYGALFDLDLVGSSWWMTEELGLNGSIATLFALLAAVAVTWTWPRTSPRAMHGPRLARV